MNHFCVQFNVERPKDVWRYLQNNSPALVDILGIGIYIVAYYRPSLPESSCISYSMPLSRVCHPLPGGIDQERAIAELERYDIDFKLANGIFSVRVKSIGLGLPESLCWGYPVIFESELGEPCEGSFASVHNFMRSMATGAVYSYQDDPSEIAAASD